MPAGVGAALAARSGAGPETPLPYTEEISHPALAAPEIARGRFRRAPDGALIREQTAPREETSRIGAGYITVMRPGETGTELLPIPDEMAPMLDAMRALLAGAPEAAIARSSAELAAAPEGWRLALGFAGGGPGLTLYGCGDRLTGLEIAEPGGTRRRIRFGAP
ncbi:hypothetical protein LNKW23_42190 [Paralimibaculum aggregatum]|uniref:Uncharacterized protein n=1 Tax=Paralimibaculum aggregatum TaxID=3036245 RepID=A0ABQ6LSE9_9RHOB|nr:LolA-related protein [Limibaculum sp. NKW23]GMG85003.1 hypothetical protein LNKW23_42190 [Limibaculum sp. NKW23]